MRLFSTKIALFKIAEDQQVTSFEDLANTVDASNAPDMNPEDFEGQTEKPALEEVLPPEEPSDVVSKLKVKLISVLGDDSSEEVREDKKLENQTDSLTAKT